MPLDLPERNLSVRHRVDGRPYLHVSASADLESDTWQSARRYCGMANKAGGIREVEVAREPGAEPVPLRNW
jgi:hypothetical protein